jgi:peroxiredoxin
MYGTIWDVKTIPLKFDQPAPDMDVQTATGETIRLSSLWAGKTLVLGFIRHFGCPQCKEMLSELVQVIPGLKRAGFNVAVITQGEPAETASFCQQYAPGILCLCNPDRSIYRAFGLPRGSLTQTILSQQVWKANNRVKKENGWKPELPPRGQDALQMSGLFIIGSDGRIRLPYYYDHIADHPPVELLLKGVLGTGWQQPFDAPVSPQD